MQRACILYFAHIERRKPDSFLLRYGAERMGADNIEAYSPQLRLHWCSHGK